MEKRFLVKWEIDYFAETPLEAIKKAIAAFPHEGNDDTLATVFDVEEIDENGKVVNTTQIDLLEEDEIDAEFNRENEEVDDEKTFKRAGI